jgi:hypothetical protein
MTVIECREAFEGYYQDRFQEGTEDGEFAAVLFHCWQACWNLTASAKARGDAVQVDLSGNIQCLSCGYAHPVGQHAMPEAPPAKAPPAAEVVDEQDGEISKAFMDMVEHGQGFMKDGKHIPHSDVFKQPHELWLDKIAKELHYPACWDTMAYPTIWDAVYELARCDKCSECREPPTQPSPVSVEGWVSMKDRKPPEDGKYLTLCLEPEDKQYFMTDMGEFDQGDWNYTEERAGGEYEVLYWAFIPKLPPAPAAEREE